MTFDELADPSCPFCNPWARILRPKGSTFTLTAEKWRDKQYFTLIYTLYLGEKVIHLTPEAEFGELYRIRWGINIYL